VQFDSLHEFFAMGGHGLYVWLAYGATALVLIGNAYAVRRARVRQLQRLQWGERMQTETQDSQTE
jgi:heme exporter protein D